MAENNIVEVSFMQPGAGAVEVEVEAGTALSVAIAKTNRQWDGFQFTIDDTDERGREIGTVSPSFIVNKSYDVVVSKKAASAESSAK